MSRIFESQNQFIIRFPQHIARMLDNYFDDAEREQPPEINLELDDNRVSLNQRIALTVSVNGKDHKATVMDLPTISSTFKTLDRVNYFKSNDITEMILVHDEGEDEENIYGEIAQKIMDHHNEQIVQFRAQSGITKPTTFIRQQNFKQKPDIQRSKVSEVDAEMEAIRHRNATAKQKEKNQTKEKKMQLQRN